jgi:urea transporter
MAFEIIKHHRSKPFKHHRFGRYVPAAEQAGTLAAIDRDWPLLARAVVLGAGQIFFVGSWGPSLLLLLSCALGSPILAAALAAGSAVGVGVALFLGVADAAIEAGLWGYNPALASAAVALFYVPIAPLSPLLMAVAACLASVLHGALSAGLAVHRLPAGTLPFCIAAVTVMLLQGALRKLVPVELDKASTPEEHRAAWVLVRAERKAAEASHS